MGDDADRAAILARRQRFIAMALSGLATTATVSACDDVPKTAPKSDDPVPQPCLKIESPPPADSGAAAQGDAATDEADSGTEPKITPVPCLSPPLPPKPTDAVPQPCLEVAPPKPPPQPCLRVSPDPPDVDPKPIPQPCLSPPRLPPEPRPEPKPKPSPSPPKPDK